MLSKLCECACDYVQNFPFAVIVSFETVSVCEKHDVTILSWMEVKAASVGLQFV